MVSVKVESMMKKEESDRVIKLSETMIKWVPHEDAASNLSSFGTFELLPVDMHRFISKLFLICYLVSDDRSKASPRSRCRCASRKAI